MGLSNYQVSNDVFPTAQVMQHQKVR